MRTFLFNKLILPLFRQEIYQHNARESRDLIERTVDRYGCFPPKVNTVLSPNLNTNLSKPALEAFREQMERYAKTYAVVHPKRYEEDLAKYKKERK